MRTQLRSRAGLWRDSLCYLRQRLRNHGPGYQLLRVLEIDFLVNFLLVNIVFSNGLGRLLSQP